MRKLFIIALVLCATASVKSGMSLDDPGKDAVGEKAWIGKSMLDFFQILPDAPSNGCPINPRISGVPEFRDAALKAERALVNEIGKRQRALKQWNEQNSKKMMENAGGVPSDMAKSQAELRKMTKEQRRKAAEDMMKEQYGVSLEDLKKLKKANDKGKVMNSVDFAKTIAGEQQANDLMKSKEQREADKRKVADIGNLTKEQALLSQDLYRATEGKAIARLEESNDDLKARSLREAIYIQQENLANMRGETYTRPIEMDFKQLPKDILNGDFEVKLRVWEGEAIANQNQKPRKVESVSCRDIFAQVRRIWEAERQYCSYMAPKLLGVLKEYGAMLDGSKDRYMRLDQINSDLQKAQTGIGLPDAGRGLSGLEAMRLYTALLKNAYSYNPGPEPTEAQICGGESGTKSD